MVKYETPATLEGAKLRLSELEGRHLETVDRLSALLDGKQHLSANDEQAADRLEKRDDAILEERKQILARWPEAGPMSIQEGRSLVTRGSWGEVDVDSGIVSNGIKAADNGVMTAQAVKRSGSSFEGMSADGFNLGRMIRGAVTGSWSDESELEQRALIGSTDSAGGYLLPDLIASRVIDRLVPKSQALNAGATIVPMENSSLAFPRLTSGVSGGWRAEGASIAVEAPSFDRVTLEAKSLAVMVKISAELLEDISEVGAAAIERDVTNALSREIDRAVFIGSGSSGQPLGIYGQTDVALKSNGTNGTTAAWSQAVDAVSTLRQANVEPTAIVVHPRTTATLAGLTDSTGQPLRSPSYLDGVRILDSTAIPINYTVGTGTTCSLMIAGDFSQVLIGVRPSFSIRVLKDASRFLDTNEVAIVATIRADVAVEHGAAFCVEKGVK